MKLHIAVGDKFGSWTVLERGPKGNHRTSRKWVVQCGCGKITQKSSNKLLGGHSRRCRQCDGRERRALMAVGQRFGHLVVESQAESRHVADKHNGYRSIRWNCRCDCGRLVDVAGFQLRQSNGTRQCLPCSRVVVGRQLRLPEGVAARNMALAGIRNRAKKRGQAWELDDETFDNLIQSPCSYCGRPPRNKARGWISCDTMIYSGIDRVDSSQGYTKENSVACCGRCNRWKSDATVEEFKAHVKLIYENLEKQNG
jgi:hypothetical protein